ncbi:hypothetical protein V2J09_012277 [Rumex salicifolius]
MFARFKQSMIFEFDMSDLGKMHYFLGIEVKKYVQEILDRFQMAKCNPTATPTEDGLKLSLAYIIWDMLLVGLDTQPPLDNMNVEVASPTPPPQKPPDPPRTWKDMVVGDTGQRRPALSDEFLHGKIKVEFPEADNFEPSVTIAPEVLQALADVWKSSVIVKPLGQFVPFYIMERKLKELWRPVGKMLLMDLPNGYYVVRFETEQDHSNALTGGPWLLFGHYLILKSWSLSFNPEQDVITLSPVWVRINNLPFLFYEGGVLMRAATEIDVPIKADTKTLFTSRG